MNKKILAAGFVLLCLTINYGSVASADIGGKTAPVIKQAFASPYVWPGENWKVYLNASDPDGQMKNIFAVVYQSGLGPYPVSITRVRKENQKEMSGYIYLVTSSPWHSLNFISLALTVWIQDQSGSFSAPVTLPLSINSRYTQEAAPSGVYKDQDLGPVMVNLRTIGQD